MSDEEYGLTDEQRKELEVVEDADGIAADEAEENDADLVEVSPYMAPDAVKAGVTKQYRLPTNLLLERSLIHRSMAPRSSVLSSPNSL